MELSLRDRNKFAMSTVTDRRGGFGHARFFELNADGDLVQRATPIPLTAAGLVQLEESQARHHSAVHAPGRAAPRPPVKEAPVLTTTDKLELAITQERGSNPALTRPQAYAAALEKHPEFYHELAAVAPPETPGPQRPTSVNLQADRAIELAIADERAGNPKLSQAQAYVEVMRKRPALFTEALGLSVEESSGPRRYPGGDSIHITG